MSLIAPLSLLLGLLALPIILLYMLRLRRRDLPISSTMLWLRLLRDREANAPWQRLRRNLLLLLQLLILALLVFALARPFLPARTVTRGSVVVLLDASASMLAREGDTDRFELARREVEKLINGLDGDAQMTIIQVGGNPQVLVSGSADRPLLRQALAEAVASPEAADWPAALALATGAAQGFEEGQIVLVSDGGLSTETPALPVGSIYVPVGTSADNLAISALATRDGARGPQLFAAVTNYGPRPQRALLNLSLGDALFDARRVELPAGESANLTWDLPEEAVAVSLRLSGADSDFLTADDEAWAIQAGGESTRVLLVSDGNRFLETALSILPGVDLFKIDPGPLPPADEQELFDLYVFDTELLPVELPDADLLLVNPRGGADGQVADVAPLLNFGGVFSETEVIRVEESPILRFVDWSSVNVRSASHVEAAWARPIVSATGGPLLLAGEQGRRRVVVLTFRLQESDLPLQIAFPVLMANIMSWFNPGSALLDGEGYAPGDPVRIGPDTGAATIIVRKPDGTLWIREVDERVISFDETDQLGIYEVLARSESDERLVGRFAVNLMSPAESRIAPADSVRLLSSSVAAPDDGSVGQRELWPWLAFLALFVLLIEWWIYHRGAQLPRRPNWDSVTGRRSR